MKLVSIAVAAAMLAGTTASRAEISEITVAQQFGVSFLPLMLMERDSLIEKHAKAAGIEVKTNWQKVAGPSVINDGLLSGNVHFGAVGAPSLITLWSRTKSNVGVKGVAAMTSYPLYFVTRNPDLKSLKDLSGKDKIAIPSVKISTQAIMLQMAAADLFGQPNYQKFDELTVSLSHPDAMVALMNNTGGVNAHFATSPFYEQEMKIPGARVLTTSYDILGGRASALVIVTTTKFHEANPKVYKAYLAAAEGSDRHDQQGQEGGREGVSGDRKRQEEYARRHPGGDRRQGLRLHAFSREGFQDRRVHGQGRHREGSAGQVAGPVLPGHPRYSGGLTFDRYGPRCGAAIIPAEAFNAAMRHHQAGQLAEAERLYAQVLAAEPGHLQALVLSGALAHMAGRNDEAVDLFGRALAINEQPDFHYNIGLAKWALGRRAEATAHWERALALNPDFAQAHMNLGNALREDGRTADAVTHLRRALALQPSPFAHNNLGLALAVLGDAEAAGHFRRAIEMHPGFVEPYMNLALELANRGDLAQALGFVRQSLRIAETADNKALFVRLACRAAGGRQRCRFARARHPRGDRRLGARKRSRAARHDAHQARQRDQGRLRGRRE